MKIRSLLLMSLLNLAAQAAISDTVRVDLIAFTQPDASANAKEETWKSPQDLKLDVAKNIIPLKFNAPLDQGLSAASTSESDALAASIKKGNYKVVAAYSWLQPLQSNSSPGVFIQGGQRYGNHYELEGTVNIYQEQNLVIAPHVWLSSFSKRASATNDPLPENPIISAEQNSSDKPAGAAETEKTTAPVQFYEAVQILDLNERRETKLGELNYFDHPVFGVLIRVSTPQATTPPASAQ